jgi:hypothetical protein
MKKMMALMLLVVACSSKTEYQFVVEKYERCMAKNAAEGVCRVEKENIAAVRRKINSALMKKHCPYEAKDINSQPDCDTIAPSRQAVKMKCLEDTVLSLKLGLKCVKSAEPRFESDEYYASGQAERDASLVR